jgi:antitoxin MazE
MHASLVKIGNSHGVRLPKAVIQQAGLHEDLDLKVVNGAVVIRAAKQTRAGWAEAARICHGHDEDHLGDWDATINDFSGGWR